MESVQSIKQRFELIGNDPGFNRAIEKAIQVAPTDISVLVTGESGVGKEVYPKLYTLNLIANTVNILLLTVVLSQKGL
ncbi:transcriptional regulator [Nonlabens ulvanivorans]|nr:transcriptional regulator [Nonlabens ulvanivorans]